MLCKSTTLDMNILHHPHASVSGHDGFPFLCVISGSRLLQPAQVCDVLKGLIMVLCFSMMHYVDYSMMYHLIRGQSVIKLYIIYNMLEVPHAHCRPYSFPSALGHLR